MNSQENKRTLKQNKSVHKYFKEVADELNGQGISQTNFIKGLEIDFSEHSVKDIFRAIGKQKYGKKSTADLTTSELQGCWEEMNRRLADFGTSIPFPSIENKEFENFYNNY